MAEEKEESALEPFVRHGTEQERIEVAADDVLNAIVADRDIDIRYAVIVGDLDIGKITSRLERDEDGHPVIKRTLRIEHSEIRENAFFDSATFQENVFFNSTTLGGSASLNSATFGGGADFDSATFDGSADFRFARFGAGAFFKSATFGRSVDFHCATFRAGVSLFDQSADFNCARFDKNASFDSARFDENVSFISATFSRDAEFGVAIFSGNAYFHFAAFNGNAYFDSATFRGIIRFDFAAFREVAHFANATMEHPANFQEVRFHENTTRVGLWNHILKPAVSFLSIGKIKLPPMPVTNFLAFNTTTVMDGSSNPYLKRYIDDEQWIASWRKRGGKWRHFLFIVWELTSHCGRSIWLWAGWSVFFAFLFAFAYTPSPDWMPERWCAFWQKYGAEFEQVAEAYANKPMGFWSSFYFSIVTFTTLGFGDVATANTFARFLVTLEVVLGYVMLGGLISIFANKLARRA